MTRVKRCSHCRDLDQSKETPESLGDCKLFPWEIGKAVGKRQALCDEQTTGEVEKP